MYSRDLHYPIICLPVRGEISWAIKDLVTLGAPVLDVDNHGAPAHIISWWVL